MKTPKLATNGLHQCDNCGEIHSATLLHDITDLMERIEPGGSVPSGECPECGALCYPVPDEAAHWDRCGSCGKPAENVEERYSFGFYAGRLCVRCCSKYRDNCGLDQDQGRVEELDEFMAGGYSAIDGDY